MHLVTRTPRLPVYRLQQVRLRLHQRIRQHALDAVQMELRPNQPNNASWHTCQQPVASIETGSAPDSDTRASSSKNSALEVRYGSARDLQRRVVA